MLCGSAHPQQSPTESSRIHFSKLMQPQFYHAVSQTAPNKTTEKRQGSGQP